MIALRILRTEEFNEWFESQTDKDQRSITSRLSNIEEFYHFGDCKNLGHNILELRWKNGRRVYFSFISKNCLLVLLGGLKNAQKKDIKKARLLNERYSNW